MPATALMITHREMGNARDAGRARPLSLTSRRKIVRARLDTADEQADCRRSQSAPGDEEPPW